MTFTAEDDRRLATWAVDVVTALLPQITYKDEGKNRRWAGGLSVHRESGWWYSFVEGRGGHSAIRLIMFLRPQYDRAQAVAWAVAFLKQHAGVGSCTADDGDDDEVTQSASREDAEQVLADEVPSIAGTLAEVYLNSRGIALPTWPPSLQFLADARTGESGLVAHLTSHGRTVGVEVTYLDPTGRKSLYQPVRRQFMLERAQDATFDLPGTDSVVIAEGIVDALSLRMAGVTSAIIGIPGVGVLQHLKLQAREVVVFRDGDPPKSAADKALIKGIDHLLLQDIDVRVTATPEGEDANALLTTVGPDALPQLIADATPAELSTDGEVTRLSRLGVIDYDQQRTEVAKKFGVRVGTLDKLVKRARPKEVEEDTDPAVPVDEPWDDEVILQEVLDDALVQIRRYIVAPDHVLATAALWAAHTHIVHSEAVRLQRSPRLAIQSRTSGCGKTTAVDIVACLSFRGKVSSSLTASVLLRTMGSEKGKRTYCIDEADRAFSDRNSDLVAILDCGDRRASAVVDRSVPTDDGGWEPREFNVWGAVCFAGIDELPGTLQDRSIRLFLEKATGAEIPEHLRDGTSEELVTIRRKLAAWGGGLLELPDPAMPDFLLRDGGLSASQPPPDKKDRTPLDPHRAQAALVQLYAGGATCFVFRGAALDHVLGSQWLRRQQVVVHNLGFDAAFVQQAFRGSIPTAWQCTMQAAGLVLGVGAYGGGRSLERAVKALLGITMPKELAISDWGAARLSPGQVAYAASDAVVTWRLWPILRGRMQADDTLEAYQLQRDAIPAVMAMELRGLGIDRDEHAQQSAQWAHELAAARQAYVDDTGQPPPSGPVELRAWLRSVLTPAAQARWPTTEKAGELSTSSKAIRRLVGSVTSAAPVLVILGPVVN